MFLVKFKSSKQISYDQWETFWEEKLFSEGTTLKEIKEWRISKYPYDKESFKVDDLYLSEPEV